jgi:hypothetical protein
LPSECQLLVRREIGKVPPGTNFGGYRDLRPLAASLLGDPTFRSQNNAVVPASLVDVVDPQCRPVEVRPNLVQGGCANVLMNLRREEHLMLRESVRNLVNNLDDGGLSATQV